MTKATRELLLKVRERVESTDWIKGSYFRPGMGEDKDRFCLVGLVNDTAGLPPSTIRQRDFFFSGYRGKKKKAADALRALYESLPRGFVSVEAWNDLTTRQRSQVLAMIDKALEEDA